MTVIIKQPSEVKFYAIDFANDIGSGDSLTSVTSVTVTPTGPTITEETISGTTVTFTIDGGTHETMYLIEAIAVTTDGETLEGDGYLYVTDTPSGVSDSIDVLSLKVTIADFLAWGRNTEGAGGTWNADTLARLEAIVKAGVRQVYYPESVAQNGRVHEWSFLVPETSLALTAPYATGTVTIVDGVVTLSDGTFPTWTGQGELVVGGSYYNVASFDSTTQVTLSDTTLDKDAGTTYSLQRYVYTLPRNFDSLRGEMVYAREDAYAATPLQQVSMQKIRQYRRTGLDPDYPQCFAIRPATFASGAGQRWELVVYPASSAAVTLWYRYKIQTATDTSDGALFAGGPRLFAAIEESCLAVAEQRFRDTGSREHTELFRVLLAAAVEGDLEAGSLPSLGPDEGGELEVSRLTFSKGIPTLTLFDEEL